MGILLDSENKRLSKGMKVLAPGVNSLVIDCNNPDFIGLEGLVPAEGEDAGGGS
jgi:hypothetical protein